MIKGVWFLLVLLILFFTLENVVKSIKKRKYKKILPTYSSLILYFCAFLCVGLYGTILGNIYLEKVSVNDESVEYERVLGILFYKPVKQSDDDKSWYEYWPYVEYSVDDKNFTWRGLKTFTMSENKKYPENHSVSVYYRVSNPSKSVVPELIDRGICEEYVCWGTYHLLTSLVFVVLIVCKYILTLLGFTWFMTDNKRSKGKKRKSEVVYLDKKF